MPNLDNYNPATFGWSAGNFESYSWKGFNFPQGVARGTSKWWNHILDLVVPMIPGGIHPGGPNVAGTWGAEVRDIAGTNTPSFHAFGLALDINAPWNGSGSGGGSNGQWLLPASVAGVMRANGGIFGGEFSDPMHIECHLSPSEIAQFSNPHGGGGVTPPSSPHPTSSFPLPAGYYFGPFSGPNESISGSGTNDAKYRPALAKAQAKLHVTADGYYGNNTANAARAFQAAHHLVADGLIGPATWKALGL